jgi:hypothetical protein
VFAVSGFGRLVSALLLLRFVHEPHPQGSAVPQVR